MISRRLLLAFLLAAPSSARADMLIYRFGNWYRIPAPGELDDGEGPDSTPYRIRRPRQPSEGTPGGIDDPNGAPDEPLRIAPRVEERRPPEDPGVAVDEREAIARRAVSPIPRKVVRLEGYEPGTIVISTAKKRLFLVLDDGASALAYGVGVGREGFSWKGTETISAKREWPDWTPPEEMRARDPKLPVHMDGGLDNPLGARALYLGETLYRIHGTNQPSSIGKSVSSGCIRLANADIIDLYGRVSVGTTVVVI